uniref:Uncharacterized protein n=1 Tax=Quercus lobata TaxID=97700 RepID=A0A7N2M648_QUELO
MVVLEAPIFDGRPDPWTLINWLDEMDQFFDQICLPDANKVPRKTNVEKEVQVPIDDVSTFMQQEEPIIESTQEEKFQQVREDLEGALDVEVDSDERATEPFMIHEVDEVQKVDTMIQDKIVHVQHIDFVFPEELYGVVELKVILLSMLPRVISNLKEVVHTKVITTKLEVEFS